MNIIEGREGLAVNEAADVIVFPYYDKTRASFPINKRNHQNKNILTKNAEEYITFTYYF